MQLCKHSINCASRDETTAGPGTLSISGLHRRGEGAALGPEEMLSYPAGNSKHNTAHVTQEVPREIL